MFRPPPSTVTAKFLHSLDCCRHIRIFGIAKKHGMKENKVVHLANYDFSFTIGDKHYEVRADEYSVEGALNYNLFITETTANLYSETWMIYDPESGNLKFEDPEHSKKQPELELKLSDKLMAIHS